MFSIDNKDIKRLEKDLKTFAERALPFATRNTLNSAAFAAQKIARADIKRDFINRNRFTIQSVQVDRAKGLNIRRQSSTIGSTADYMETQEFGGTNRKTGREGLPIATSYSAGLGIKTKPRTRLVRKSNALENIKLRKRSKKGANRKQSNLIAIRKAKASGQKFIYLETHKTKGIFRVLGSRKKPKIHMVHSLEHQSVTIKKNPWLKPSFDESARMIPAFYADSLRFQLRRRGLFKN